MGLQLRSLPSPLPGLLADPMFSIWPRVSSLLRVNIQLSLHRVEPSVRRRGVPLMSCRQPCELSNVGIPFLRMAFHAPGPLGPFPPEVGTGLCWDRKGSSSPQARRKTWHPSWALLRRCGLRLPSRTFLPRWLRAGPYRIAMLHSGWSVVVQPRNGSLTHWYRVPWRTSASHEDFGRALLDEQVDRTSDTVLGHLLGTRCINRHGTLRALEQ